MMANQQQSLSLNPPFGGPSASAPTGAATQVNKDRKLASAEQLVLELCNPDLRENALLDLSKKREIFQDLAPLLWNSFGTIAALLQEIVSIYPVLSPPNLTAAASNRVCNALALLQCVASHQDTRTLFLTAHIPLYLYPFLNTTSKTRPFEYLRLTSLGVIGALVKVDDTEVISFLLSTEIIPLCLRTMEMGSELSKTVATFIVQKILLDDIGLHYICATAERFFAVGRVLGTMVASLAEQPSSRLLKHIIRCYLRLSDNPRACEALRNCLPEMLRDPTTFSACLREDPTTKRWLQQLIHNVSGGSRVAAALQAGSGLDHMLGNQTRENKLQDGFHGSTTILTVTIEHSQPKPQRFPPKLVGVGPVGHMDQTLLSCLTQFLLFCSIFALVFYLLYFSITGQFTL